MVMADSLEWLVIYAGVGEPVIIGAACMLGGISWRKGECGCGCGCVEVEMV